MFTGRLGKVPGPLWPLRRPSNASRSSVSSCRQHGRNYPGSRCRVFWGGVASSRVLLRQASCLIAQLHDLGGLVGDVGLATCAKPSRWGARGILPSQRPFKVTNDQQIQSIHGSEPCSWLRPREFVDSNGNDGTHILRQTDSL